MRYNFNINKKANSLLVIDVDAIVSNYQTLRSKLTKAYCAATLKANAYGLGIKKIAPALDKAGCQTFFVATLDEAVELRKILISKRKTILVVGSHLHVKKTRRRQIILIIIKRSKQKLEVKVE